MSVSRCLAFSALALAFSVPVVAQDRRRWESPEAIAMFEESCPTIPART
jgi:hypothetical protein